MSFSHLSSSLSLSLFVCLSPSTSSVRHARLLSCLLLPSLPPLSFSRHDTISVHKRSSVGKVRQAGETVRRSAGTSDLCVIPIEGIAPLLPNEFPAPIDGRSARASSRLTIRTGTSEENKSEIPPHVLVSRKLDRRPSVGRGAIEKLHQSKASAPPRRREYEWRSAVRCARCNRPFSVSSRRKMKLLAARRQIYRTSSLHERSRRTGDWRRDDDLLPSPRSRHLHVSLPSPVSHPSATAEREPHTTALHPYPTLSPSTHPPHLPPFRPASPPRPFLRRPAPFSHSPAALFERVNPPHSLDPLPSRSRLSWSPFLSRFLSLYLSFSSTLSLSRFCSSSRRPRRLPLDPRPSPFGAVAAAAAAVR